MLRRSMNIFYVMRRARRISVKASIRLTGSLSRRNFCWRPISLSRDHGVRHRRIEVYDGVVHHDHAYAAVSQRLAAKLLNRPLKEHERVTDVGGKILKDLYVHVITPLLSASDIPRRAADRGAVADVEAAWKVGVRPRGNRAANGPGRTPRFMAYDHRLFGVHVPRRGG